MDVLTSPNADIPSPRSRPRTPGKSPVVAAGLTAAVAAIGLAIVLIGRSGTATPKLATAAQLAASAEAVGTRHPELRLDTEPMSATELASLAAKGFDAGGLWVLDPVGTSTTDRPTVRWLRVDGATAYDVRVEANGKEIFRESTKDDHLAFPVRREPLLVGTRYVVRVRAGFTEPRLEDAMGRSEFAVLPIPHRAGWRSIVGDVESNEPAPIRDLLVAHLALRKGLFGEALRRADAWSLAHPGDAAARPVLEALSRLFHFDAAPPPYAGFAGR